MTLPAKVWHYDSGARFRQGAVAWKELHVIGETSRSILVCEWPDRPNWASKVPKKEFLAMGFAGAYYDDTAKLARENYDRVHLDVIERLKRLDGWAAWNRFAELDRSLPTMEALKR